MITPKRSIATLLALILLVGTAPGAWAADTPTAPPPPPPGAPPAPPAAAPGAPPAAAPTATADDDDQVAPDQPEGAAPTPARLSYTAGDVSFWRPGGDGLGARAGQHAARARRSALHRQPRQPRDPGRSRAASCAPGATASSAWRTTNPDFLQLKVAAGHVSLDLRSLEPGRTVEVDTPAAAFTISHTGYYRVDVTPDRTTFVTRRGGVATMTPAGGPAVAIATSEQAVVTGRAPRRCRPSWPRSSTCGTGGTTRAPTPSSTP